MPLLGIVQWEPHGQLDLSLLARDDRELHRNSKLIDIKVIKKY